MTAALIDSPAAQPLSRVILRAAPRREPPFDDELPQPLPPYGPHDRALPFERTPPRTAAWRARPARPSGLPDPTPWGRRLLVGMIETAAGRRPLHQLSGLLSPSVCRGIGADFERAAQIGKPHWLHRASIRSVRATQPADGVAELCATLEVGRRVRALAMRLEEHRGRWRCTRLQLG
ncbi:MAG TPA: Rv3235 family protein [Jatrophihabitans sp.]|jgi:hypothetical protein|nr:Rv3235 family protein [Jatrophihabitans sp.]